MCMREEWDQILPDSVGKNDSATVGLLHYSFVYVHLLVNILAVELAEAGLDVKIMNMEQRQNALSLNAPSYTYEKPRTSTGHLESK
jgi:hypothetical protein